MTTETTTDTTTMATPEAEPATEAAGTTASAPDITILPVRPDRHSADVHAWLSHPRSHFWQMTDLDEPAVRNYLSAIRASVDENGWIGFVDGVPRFYVETYLPAVLIPTEVIPETPGDIGMHLLVAPPDARVVHRLTDRIMAHVIDFCLRPRMEGGRGATRVVVEPDVRNEAIHAKNAAAGFQVVGEAEIPMGNATKTGLISVCTRADFGASRLAALIDSPLRGADGAAAGEANSGAGATVPQSAAVDAGTAISAEPTDDAAVGEARTGGHLGGESGAHLGGEDYAHLTPEIVAQVNRHLVAKALAEFAHERLIAPVRLAESSEEIEGAREHRAEGAREDGAEGAPESGAEGAPESLTTSWVLTIPTGTRTGTGHDSGRHTPTAAAGTIHYTFEAALLPLEHWAIDETTIVRYRDGRAVDLDAQEIILELQDALGVPESLVSTYLEEIASTLAGGAFKLAEAQQGRRPAVAALADADFQTIEAAMTEGHPGFVANNGRIGFGLRNYRRWAPENGRRNRLEWIAVSREHAHLALGEGLDETAHLAWALSDDERELFSSRLAATGRRLGEVHLMPIHPWQAEHRLAITFAADIARGDLIPLGPGLDEHQAQQSLRTFFNHTRAGAPYAKVALAVQNMGFLRGLSPAYMRDTPAINDWVARLVDGDPTFAASGFRVLRERSAIGYTGDAYHRTRETNPHRKMLAGLWRENPLPLLGAGQRTMTMAALLHRDHLGAPFVGELIRRSGLGAEDWIRAYLEAYLRPLVHGLLAHDLVFMPHGENLILVLEDEVVTGTFMKDIGEEVAYLGEGSLPTEVERIRAIVPGEEKALSIFTDVFDGVLRHLAGILDVDRILAAGRFWSLVAEVLDRYESAHPETARGLAGDIDLRAGRFKHSCLNRLQLRNTTQMVDLGNQADSLIYAGTMRNPVGR